MSHVLVFLTVWLIAGSGSIPDDVVSMIEDYLQIDPLASSNDLAYFLATHGYNCSPIGNNSIKLIIEKNIYNITHEARIIEE